MLSPVVRWLKNTSPVCWLRKKFVQDIECLRTTVSVPMIP